MTVRILAAALVITGALGSKVEALTTEIGPFVGAETITFDSLPSGQAISTQFPGVTFTNWVASSECNWHITTCSSANILAASSPTGAGFLQAIKFDLAQERVGFELGSNINVTATIQILLAGVLLDQFVYSQSHNFSAANRIFRGFENLLGFDEIRFAFSGGTHHINNLTYDASAVPLPAALPLFGSGLGAMGLLNWWRRRRSAA